MLFILAEFSRQGSFIDCNRDRAVASSTDFWTKPPFHVENQVISLSDVGATYTLVTIGFVGLVLFYMVLFVLSQYGYRSFRKGYRDGKMMKSALGMVSSSRPF